MDNRTKIQKNKKISKQKSFQEEAIQKASDLIIALVFGSYNLFGMYIMSSKTLHEGSAYRNFMRKHYLHDPEIGELVKNLPHLWILGNFRFDILWIVFFISIVWLNEIYLHFESGVTLAGKFGYGKIEALYVLLFIIWIGLYFMI